MKIKRLCKLISYGLSFVLCCQLYSSVAFAQTKPVVQEFTQQETQLAAYPYSAYLNVPRYAQETDKWCWAACIQMIAAYHGLPTSQSTICQLTFGGIINQGAPNRYVASTLQQLIGRTCVYQQSYFSYDQVKNKISNNKTPFIIGIRWVNGAMHDVVCYGYNNVSNVYINIHDPWYVGPSSYAISYNDAINKGNFGSGTGSWVETVSY